MVNSYGEIGGTLRQRDIQYVAHKDDLGIWRVLDTWHQEMTTKTLTDDLDIPDDSDLAPPPIPDANLEENI